MISMRDMFETGKLAAKQVYLRPFIADIGVEYEVVGIGNDSVRIKRTNDGGKLFSLHKTVLQNYFMIE